MAKMIKIGIWIFRHLFPRWWKKIWNNQYDKRFSPHGVVVHYEDQEADRAWDYEEYKNG